MAKKIVIIVVVLSLCSFTVCSTESNRTINGVHIPYEAQALLAFKSKTDIRERLKFSSATDHCKWPGVFCSAQGKIERLVLENVDLTGQIPNGTIDRLYQLRVLSLKSNSLTGRIPNLSALVNLKAVYLSYNRFTGTIPASLVSLDRLHTLDLAHNKLTGDIPGKLALINPLYVLRLESNNFTGALPALNQTSLISFNVSNNNFSGPVLVTAALARFGLSAFAGNPGLCGLVVRKECSKLSFFKGNGGQPVSSALPPIVVAGQRGRQQQQQQFQGVLIQDKQSPSPKKHRRTVLAAASLVGAVLLIGFVLVSLVLKKRKKVRKGNLLTLEESNNSSAVIEHSVDGNDDADLDNELVPGAAMSEDKVKKFAKSGCLVFCAGEAPVYTLEQLMRASAELLGKGSIGTTYKAVLDHRLLVCVKRLDAAKLGMTRKETFERHMDRVGMLWHPNVVPLQAFFHAKEERLLVYDYQPNGSLFSLIHGSRSTRAKPLHWTSCLKIAEDVAQGLAYIHQASRLVHGNVKSSNVLLGSDFEACLADSCLALLVESPEGEDDSGYRAPETRKSNRRLTAKSDIYAFGVLLLELLTGKPPLQHPVLVATDLPVWVHSVRDGHAIEDERLIMLVDIAAGCVRSSPESRPTSWQVLKMIQEIKEVETEDKDLDPTHIS